MSASLTGCGRRREAFHLGKKRIDLGTRRACRRRAAAVSRWPILAIMGHGIGTSIGGNPAGP
jgi:hypothetical protein